MAKDFNKYLNIEYFKSNSSLYDNLGIPLTNRYACLLTPPPNLSNSASLDFQVLEVNCPSISLETGVMQLNGVNRYYFKSREHDDLSITFLETSDLLLRDYFYQWIALGVDINDTGGVSRGYLEDITAPSFSIMPLDQTGRATKSDIFESVFPTRIQDINYNYSTSGDIIKTVVTFKYLFHFIDTI